MKVLLATAYLPPHLGGVERYVRNLSAGLVKQGCEVVLVATRDEDTDEAHTRRLFAEVGVDRIHLLPTRWRFSNTPVGTGWWRALRRIVAEERVDLVNGHAPVPVLPDIAARATRGLPFVLTYHAGPLQPVGNVLDLAATAYQRLVLPRTVARADLVIGASDYPLRELPGRVKQHANVPAVVDTDEFTPGSHTVPGRIVFVANLDQAASYKRLDDVLEALAVVKGGRPEAHLVVVGEGDARPGYERHAASLGLSESVHFRGALAGRELAEAYRSAAVHVVPSSFDSYPTVLLEAMASAVPSVATDVGDIALMMQPGLTGEMVPAHRPDLLAERVGGLLDDPAAARLMGARARDRAVAEFGVEAMGRATVAAYRRVLSG